MTWFDAWSEVDFNRNDIDLDYHDVVTQASIPDVSPRGEISGVGSVLCTRFYIEGELTTRVPRKVLNCSLLNLYSVH